MVRKLLCVVVGQFFVYQVFAANLQSLHPALKQYLLAGLGSQPTQSYPPVAINKQTSTPNFQSLAALASLLSAPKPAVAKPPPAHATNSLLAALTAEPAVAAAPASSSIDASLVNNLAIALQLLLVNNILNTAPQDSTANSITESVIPAYSYESQEPVSGAGYQYMQHNHQMQPVQSNGPNQYIYEQPLTTPSYNPYETRYSYESTSNYPSIPNANFVGGSTFADSNPFGGTIPPASSSSSRAGFSLMSPYEALSPSSPYSDPILSSPYGSVMTSKKDFQSPYSTIMAADNKDLFSMSDFF